MSNEPVAYAYRDEKGELVWSSFTPVILPDGWTETPLYTRPPVDPEPALVAEGLVEKLNERAKRLRSNNASCQLIVDLLQPEMDKFDARTGHDLYTVRMAVDHVSSIRTQTKEAEELEQAAARLQSDAAELARLREALTYIADMPDPGEDEERSATFYRVHASFLKLVAAKGLGRQTVSQEAMDWAESGWAESAALGTAGEG